MSMILSVYKERLVKGKTAHWPSMKLCLEPKEENVSFFVSFYLKMINNGRLDQKKNGWGAYAVIIVTCGVELCNKNSDSPQDVSTKRWRIESFDSIRN